MHAIEGLRSVTSSISEWFTGFAEPIGKGFPISDHRERVHEQAAEGELTAG